jgi:hypothetical protein
MAIDQRDVSSTLRFMDDRALQQYAAMHKNDPYIFPLAFQESQNRQKLRMSQQAQMAQQPQPKVSDQALAQMAPQQPRPMAQPMPEAQGIGALPAGNMEGMADGGIVGYEGYDETPRQFSQEPVIMMAEGGHVPRYQGNPQDRSLVRMPYGGDTMGMPSFAQEELAAQASNIAIGERERARVLAELQQKADFLTSIDAPQAESARAQLEAFKTSGVAPKPTAATAPTTTPTPAGYTRGAMEGDPRLNTPPSKPFVAAPTGNRDAATRPDTGRKPTAAAPTTTEPSEKTETGGLDSLVKKFTRDTELAQGALQNRRVGFASQLEKEATDEAEATKKRIKDEGDVFAGKEARLAAREKGIEGMGDKYMGLALLQAGAAMMSTPGKIGTVLGKGIAVGSERYIAGIDKINAAKDKFAEARDRLDDLRLNRDDMNKKEIRDAERAVRTSRVQGQQLLIDGATNDLKISNDNQKAIFGVVADDLKTDKTIKAEAARTDKQIRSAENIAAIGERGANARAMTPDKLVFDQLTKQYGGDTVKAAEALQKMKTEKFNVYDAYSKYLQAFAGKDTLKGPDDFEVFAKRFIPTVTPGKNTTVRTQPGG